MESGKKSWSISCCQRGLTSSDSKKGGKKKAAGVAVTRQTDGELQYPGSRRAEREAGDDQLRTKRNEPRVAFCRLFQPEEKEREREREREVDSVPPQVH